MTQNTLKIDQRETSNRSDRISPAEVIFDYFEPFKAKKIVQNNEKSSKNDSKTVKNS